MNYTKRIKLAQIWKPPVDNDLSLNLSGNMIIDKYSEWARTEEFKPLWHYAYRLNISSWELNTAFRRATGMLASTWRYKLLLYDAKWYLLNTMFSLKEISKRLHMKSTDCFTSFFIRHQKMGASNYRRRYQKIEIVRKIIIHEIEIV